MQLFYTSILQSIIAFSIICWFGNSSVEAKCKISRVIKICSKLGVTELPLEEIYRKCLQQRCKIIRTDDSHPLHNLYVMLPSGRRLRSLKCRTSRYSKSFVPSSIRILNEM